MKNAIHFIKYRFLIILLLFISACELKAEDIKKEYVLIITSYNPDTRTTAENISLFIEEYKKRDGKLPIYVKSINVQNLSDIHFWRYRIGDILSEYESNPPSLLILLGQEAWSSFLSLDKPFIKQIPVICAMVSSKTVILPESSCFDIAEWMPEPKDVIDDFRDFNIISGFVYDYSVKQNLNLIKYLYPQTNSIHFLSDNSLGGIIMQSTLRGFLQNYNDLKVNFIDGRKLSFIDVIGNVRSMEKDDCILVGTWKFDKSGDYIFNNASAILCEVNPTIPVFSLSSASLGSWAVGGYIPRYRNIGKDLADVTIDYLSDTSNYKKAINYVSNEYRFDGKRMKELNINEASLPSDCIINKEPTLYDKYKSEFYVVVTAFISLIIIIIIAIYYLLKINRLKHNLELSAVELVKAKDKAEESNKIKSSFLANMSHEIRTPLNAIVGFSSVLASEELNNEDKLLYSEIINNNSETLLHLIDDILDFSRMECGKVNFEFTESNIVDLCFTSMSTVEYSNRTSAKFRFLTNRDTFVMNTDPQRLKQVLINLLTNAAKFTPEGEILLNLTADDNKITIFVQDTGCGIPKEKKDVVFIRFEKLNEFAQGTGLGLPICRLIVENLGGKIWLDTDYEDGAKFVFELPVVRNTKKTDET